MTMTAIEAGNIRGEVIESSDVLALGRKLNLGNLIADYHADIKLTNGGKVSVKLSTGAFYVLELA